MTDASERVPPRTGVGGMAAAAGIGAAAAAAAGIALQLAAPSAPPLRLPALPVSLAAGPFHEPAAPDPAHVAPFFLTQVSPEEHEQAVRCLTNAVFYEAANEPEAGQRAVAQVVINRVRDPHFPKSVCGVVYEGWERRTGCQFSFVCDGSLRRRRARPDELDRLRPIAEAALTGYVDDEVGAATHYHADYVRPAWRSSVARVAEIGRHIFYSWKGRAGLPSALVAPYVGGESRIAEAVIDGLRPKAARLARLSPRRGRPLG